MKSFFVVLLLLLPLLHGFEENYSDEFSSTSNDDGIQIEMSVAYPDSGYIRLGACEKHSESHVTIDVSADLETPPLYTTIVYNEGTEQERTYTFPLTDANSISNYHKTIQIPPKVLHVDADPVISYASEGSRVQRLGRCSHVTTETVYGGAEDVSTGPARNVTARDPNKPGWWWKWHHGNKNWYRGGWYCNCHDNSGKHLFRCTPNGKILPQQHGFMWGTPGHSRAAPEIEIDREIMPLKGERASRKGDEEIELPDDLLDAPFQVYVGIKETDVVPIDVSVRGLQSLERDPPGPGNSWKWKWGGAWWGGGQFNCKDKFWTEPVHYDNGNN